MYFLNPNSMGGGRKRGKKRAKRRGRRRQSSRSSSFQGQSTENKLSKSSVGVGQETTVDLGSAVSRVFAKVELTEKIMEFYFHDFPSKGADVSPLGMVNSYWLSCHDYFVARHTDMLVRAWFEECCDDTGIFALNRSKRAEKFLSKLKKNHFHCEWVEKLVVGASAVCFSKTRECFAQTGNVASNINIMALLQIISEPRFNCFGVALSTARHLMAQWMYLSIGEWRVEMEKPEQFKKNLVEMCSSLKKAKLGGCRPAEKVFQRGRMLFQLVVAFENKDVKKVKRIVKYLK